MALGMTDTQKISFKEVIPKDYLEFQTLFSKVVAETLLLYLRQDHKIKPQEGFIPLFGPSYSISQKELQVLKQWIENTYLRVSSGHLHYLVLFQSSLPSCWGRGGYKTLCGLPKPKSRNDIHPVPPAIN
jgi:hypothetical protein